MFDDEDERPLGAAIDDGDFDGEDNAPAGNGPINDPDGEGDPDLEGTGNPDDEDHLSDDIDGTDVGTSRRPSEVKPSRGSARFQALNERTRKAEQEAREAREHAQRIERQLNERQNSESAEMERARLSLMNPDEKTEYLLNKQERQMNQKFAAMEFRSADMADRTAFTTLASQDKALASVSAEVERVLQEQRLKGFNPNRETVATFLLGQKMRERAKNAAPKQKTRAAERVARETTRPMNGRGDVSKPAVRSGNGKSDIEKRLAGIKI